MDWDTHARELGRALSRYNGLTNSAELGVMTKVITGELFDTTKPFHRAFDVINAFADEAKKHKPRSAFRSAEVLLHHAIAFGFLRRATPGGTMSRPELKRKQEATSHIALTALGRACRAAVNWQGGGDEFRQFLWNYALLECDFDMYGLLLKSAEENGGEVVSIEEFYRQFYGIREGQMKWMKEWVPYKTHREHIQRNVKWVGKQVVVVVNNMGAAEKRVKRVFELDAIFKFFGATPGHHFDQRKKWARRFGHIDEGRQKLTESGRQLSSRLPPVSDEPPFFWLGPTEECAKAKIISAAKIPDTRWSPAWRLLRPETRNESLESAIVEKTAAFMEGAFEHIRLSNAAQASLDAVVPYVYFLEHKMGGRVGNEHDIFRQVIARHRDCFACLLQPNLSQSHYRLREE